MFASQVTVSVAFYPADLLLPPLTGYRTAVSMLLLLLAGIITLCYAQKVLRNTARVPDSMSHPIYDVGGPIAVPSFDLRIAVQVLEAHAVAGLMAPALQKATKALDCVRVSIADGILAGLLNFRTAIRQALIGGVVIGTDARST